MPRLPKPTLSPYFDYVSLSISLFIYSYQYFFHLSLSQLFFLLICYFRLLRICPPSLHSCLLRSSHLRFGQNIPLTVSLSLGSVAWTPVTSGQNFEWNILNLRRHPGREIQTRRDITASDQLNGETVSSQETKSLPEKFPLTFFFVCMFNLRNLQQQNSAFHTWMWAICV